MSAKHTAGIVRCARCDGQPLNRAADDFYATPRSRSDGEREVTYADGNYLVLTSGERVGPFSSHWAACAAMIRLSDPTFRSTGGDRQSDLDLEAGIAALARMDSR